ncbi:GumC family protein [uncultured Phascolarctobacterium sp.]|uniref:GumC family protein n=1 Tax=uncultured Phascolarctobacterium sp. TaxID=512296 RepID=UPI0025DAAC47|nr:GumC family protein [uncultured Phascolarctobacterium sp.]
MSNNFNEEEITIDLREIGAILKRNAANIARVTGVCIVAAGVYLAVATPVYESQALLRVKQPKGIGSSLLEAMPMGNAMANTQLMNTYAEILKSRSVIVPVIEKTEEPNKEGKFPDYAGYVKGKVATAPFKDTEIMQLTVRANTAEKAQKANSLIVEGFLNRLTELSRDQQKATRGFIEERTATAKKELKDAEDKLTEYKKANDIIAPDDAVKLATEKMGMVDKLNAENRVALATANARLASTNAQLNGEAASIADNKSIQLYNSQLAQLEGERISYLDKYTAQHPKVKQVEQEIAKLKQKINSEISKVASLQAPSDNPVHQQLLAAKFQSEAEASVAQSNLAKLHQIDNDNKEDIRNLSDKEQEFVSLMRDVTVANEIYVMLAKRLEEAKVAEASVATEVQVVDTATLPTAPVAPKKAMTLLLAALLGILASSGFVVVRELLNRTIKNSDDVANYLELPVLGSVPDMNDLRKDMEKNDKGPGLLAKIWRKVWKA